MEKDTILVLIQLIGGNDSLNTFVPLASYEELTRHRANILIPQNKLLVHDKVGFHPAVSGLYSLYNAGELCLINNIGYPMPNRSHFRSMDIWNSGSPSNEQWNTGWIGRLLDLYHRKFPVGYPSSNFPDPLAISLGSIVSDTCQGQFHNFSHVVDNLDVFTEVDRCAISAYSNRAYGELMTYLDSTIKLSNLYTRQIESAAKKGNTLHNYPANNQLARELKIVSQLISGGLQTKIYVLSINGFDTHAYQTAKDDATQGMHSIYLKLLSEAVHAFTQDLKKLGHFNRVSILAYSEFGRQIKSNASFGTDHGDATSLFMIGNSLAAPMLGNLPVIGEHVEQQAGLSTEIDFRNFYSSFAEQWFGLPRQEAQSLFTAEARHYTLFKT